MTIEEIKSKLCYYDRRNPDSIAYDVLNDDDCYCDNCFYGRSKLAEELLLQISKLEEIKKKLNEIKLKIKKDEI